MARGFDEERVREKVWDALVQFEREDIDEIEDYLGIYGIGWNEAPGVEQLEKQKKKLIDSYVKVLRWLYKHRDKSYDIPPCV